jgi:hypothetical protein
MPAQTVASVWRGAVRASLCRVPTCHDGIVTAHGLPGEPMPGWLTGSQVRRAAKG